MKKSDGTETCSSSSISNLQVQTNKEDDKRNEGLINPSFIFMPTTYAIDEWLATSTQNNSISDKYTITSTGNGNVDISGK